MLFRSAFCVIALVLTGCTTSTVHVFEGRIANLVGDGWIEDGTRLVGRISSQPSVDGGTLLGLGIDPMATFGRVMRHPALQPGQTLHASSTNGGASGVVDPR